MKLCVAQTRPVKGDIPANIERHIALIEFARGADVIIFPELSLTGYEPTLAKELAIEPDDSRLDEFQAISDSSAVTLGVGAPTRSTSGPRITMFLFQPRKPRLTYSKRYLHPDEEPFFVAGQQIMTLNVNRAVIAPAICYELSVREHSENAARSGASVYMASVAKTAKGLDAAIPALTGIAHQYSMTVLMANSVGECDGCECAGKTSAWNNKALLVGQLNDRDEGVLTIDTDTEEAVGQTV
jgi:predicted amidohydrolase